MGAVVVPTEYWPWNLSLPSLKISLVISRFVASFLFQAFFSKKHGLPFRQTGGSTILPCSNVFAYCNIMFILSSVFAMCSSCQWSGVYIKRSFIQSSGLVWTGWPWVLYDDDDVLNDVEWILFSLCSQNREVAIYIINPYQCQKDSDLPVSTLALAAWHTSTYI